MSMHAPKGTGEKKEKGNSKGNVMRKFCLRNAPTLGRRRAWRARGQKGIYKVWSEDRMWWTTKKVQVREEDIEKGIHMEDKEGASAGP